jgi:DNA (cytosine-5)-methyltransferase 1
MGFPDGYTDIVYRGKPASDSARYRAINNSIVTTVLSWIGKRLDFVDRLP